MLLQAAQQLESATALAGWWKSGLEELKIAAEYDMLFAVSHLLRTSQPSDSLLPHPIAITAWEVNCGRVSVKTCFLFLTYVKHMLTPNGAS